MTSLGWKYYTWYCLIFFFLFFSLPLSLASQRIMIIKHFKHIKWARERIINSTCQIRTYANAFHNFIVLVLKQKGELFILNIFFYVRLSVFHLWHLVFATSHFNFRLISFKKIEKIESNTRINLYRHQFIISYDEPFTVNSVCVALCCVILSWNDAGLSWNNVLL